MKGSRSQAKNSWLHSNLLVLVILIVTPHLLSCQMGIQPYPVEQLEAQGVFTSDPNPNRSPGGTPAFEKGNQSQGVIQMEVEGPAILYHEIECPPDDILRILDRERSLFDRSFVEFGISWPIPRENQDTHLYTRYRCIPR